MWAALNEASDQPGVGVAVYVHAAKADAEKVKQRIRRATIYRSATLPNRQRIVSHAKFVVMGPRSPTRHQRQLPV